MSEMNESVSITGGIAGGKELLYGHWFVVVCGGFLTRLIPLITL